MIKISQRVWINPKYIQSVHNDLTETITEESIITSIDADIVVEIEKMKESLQKEYDVVVEKVSEQKEDEHGTIYFEDVKKTAKMKLCDVTRENSGDIKLCDKKDQIELKIRDLEEKAKVEKVELIEKEVPVDGYTIVMNNGDSYDVKDNPYRDNVRDNIIG